MKKLVFGLIATVMFGLVGNAQNLVKVGEIKDGVFIITEDINGIKVEWDKILQEQKIVGEFSNYVIESDVDVELNNEIYYYLLANSKDNILKAARLLKLDKGNFYLDSNPDSFMFGVTVTCSGCAFGCHPKRGRGFWYCTPDCGSDCTKSETITGHVSN